MVWIVRMRESVLPTARVMEEMTFDTYREAHAWLGTKMAESEPIPGMVYGHWREGQPAFKADVIKVPHLGLVPISTSVVLDQIEGLAANRVSGYDNQQARLLEIRDQIRRLRATTLPEYEYEARVTSGDYVGERGPVVAGAPPGDVDIELSLSGRKRVSHGQYQYRRYGSHGTWTMSRTAAPRHHHQGGGLGFGFGGLGFAGAATEPAPSAPLRSFAGFAGAPQIYIRVTHGEYECEEGLVVSGSPPGNLKVDLEESGRKPVNRGQYVIL